MTEYLTKENNIENMIDDFGPNRHDQEIMIICAYEGDYYCLEKIQTNKYGGFTFNEEAIKSLLSKVQKWTEITKTPCLLAGRCFGNY